MTHADDDGYDEARDEEILALFRRAAIEAGDAVLGFFGEACETRAKADASPVTEADLAAEAIILGHLRDGLPGVPAVAEEEAAAGRLPPEIGRRFLLVDPLDGTREFVAGRPEFTVNVALVVDGRPRLGVVLAPASGELFTGSPKGAVKAVRDAGGRFGPDAAICVRPVPADGLVALASRSHRTGETDRFLRRMAPQEVRAIGSSLKFGRVAEGAADLYPCFGRTMEWDTAAGQAVLEAAGGRVVTAGGAALRYGKRGRGGSADFANPSFVATGGGVLPPF